jgi:hypothetical protein
LLHSWNVAGVCLFVCSRKSITKYRTEKKTLNDYF